MVKRTHGDLVNACLTVLAAYRVFAWKNATGMLPVGKRMVRFGKKGSSDILGAMPGGTIIAVECKVGRDVLSDDQIQFLSDIQCIGGVGLEVRDTVDSLAAFLKGWKR